MLYYFTIICINYYDVLACRYVSWCWTTALYKCVIYYYLLSLVKSSPTFLLFYFTTVAMF